MKTTFTDITTITGHVTVTPPRSLGAADKARCHVANLFLRIRRQGSSKHLALYPAQMNAMLWDFIIDDTWRLAKTGFYVGEVLCCDRVLKTSRFRLMETPVGGVIATSMVKDMCDDPLLPHLPAAAEPCCVDVVPDCNYESRDCCPAPPLPTGVIPAVDCNTAPIPCPC